MNARFLLLTVLLPVVASAQFLPRDTPLQQAIIEANQKDKLIFLLIESADCQQCNDVADKALQHDSLKNDLKRNFIALRISPLHPDLNYIKEKYNYLGGNAVLYIDKWGTLVHRMNSSTTNYNKYVLESMQATMKKTEADHVRTLEAQALTGALDCNQLYALLELRKTLSLSTDALLNQYVKQLPADSLTSVTTLQRIAQMSPMIGSPAEAVLRKNRDLFLQAWYRIPQNDRSAINRQIIFKSRQQAIADKSLSMANEVASFAKVIHTGKEAGEKAYHYNLMEYYRGIHDTVAYLKAAVDYYDQFQMSVNVDDIKKQDSLKRMSLIDQFPKDTVKKIGNSMSIRTVTTFSSTAQFYGQELNYGARSFYLMTNDNAYLKKALQWAAYANEFYESPYALDTWARLLYKADKNVDQAVQLEEKAIALLQKQGLSTETHVAVLDKMKKGNAAID